MTTVRVTVAVGETLGDGETRTDGETLTEGETLTDAETLTDGEVLASAKRAPFVPDGLADVCVWVVWAPRAAATRPPMTTAAAAALPSATLCRRVSCATVASLRP